MITTEISRVAHLVEICVKHGVTKVVLSPGSRNAPLIIAFNAHPTVEVYLIHDERCAAFVAMGMAEEAQKPVAIACTSGSAPINYAPAISEAYYRNIPLLVLTADRPAHLIDQGDGQTIRQKGLYRNFIKAEFELPASNKSSDLLESDQYVNQAIQLLKTNPKGPVHINIPLEEPLYQLKELTTVPFFNATAITKPQLSSVQKNEIKKIWNESSKKLILIGQLHTNQLDKTWMQTIINDPSVAVLVENTANFQDFHSVCHCIDRSLAAIHQNEIENFVPDLLISVGGAIISKKIKAFFRTHKPKHNWKVGEFFFEEDTFQSLTATYKVSPKTFFNFLASFDTVPNSNFGNQWKQRDFLVQEIHHNYLLNSTFSDLKVFHTILDAVPEHTNLHMANSSVVRYCQLFEPIQTVRYYSNRGVSGIDGSTSTAAGISLHTPNRLNLLITGDTSFFYDSNGLWNQYLTNNFRIILINNGGGEIFNIIDGPSQTSHSSLFVAPFKAKAKSICEAFNIDYFQVSSIEELQKSFNFFYAHEEKGRPKLIEVNTSFVDNSEVLKAYFRQITAAFLEGAE